MKPSLRIVREEALTIVLSGLTESESAHLQKILFTSQRIDRPGFGRPKPGTFTIHGSSVQLQHCVTRLAEHEQLSAQVRALFGSRLDNYLRSDYKIVLKDRTLDLDERTHLMGVLNVTPDSFSDGGKYAGPEQAVARAREMTDQGADLIDVGGESTRPGADPLPEEEELRRVIPVIERISTECAVPVSIDTYKASVAERALRAGASIVNDISGLRFSPDMAKVIADNNAAVVLMHIKGTPRDMQADPQYDDVIGEICTYLEESIEIAFRAGIPRERVLIDPGIGFGKTVQHNLTILRRLDEFRVLGCPIVLGTSRKRFIGTVLGISEPSERIEGTAATVSIGIERGAHILRVHDVAQMVQVARMTDAVLRAGSVS